MKAIGTVFPDAGLSPELLSILDDGLTRKRSPTLPSPIGLDASIKALKLCESPIEQIMLIGLVTMLTDVVPVVHDPRSTAPFPTTYLVISPQFNIGRYRVDFLITIQKKSGPFNFAVECDGIEFHGALKIRAADAARDQYLRELGIKTVRYYGQQIVRLGHQCADEIAAIVNEEINS